MSGRASGKPRLTPAEEADMLPPPPTTSTTNSPLTPPPPPPPQVAVQSLLPPEIELPPGDDSPPSGMEVTTAMPNSNSMEATMAWTAPPAHPPVAPAPPLVMSQVRAPVRRLSPEERAQRRMIKNAVLFGFFVVVLLVIFWAMARK